MVLLIIDGFHRRRIESDSESNPMIVRDIDESQTVQVDQDNVYAVFVTYVEIYNNSVYDLLEDEDIRNKYSIITCTIQIFLISNNILILRNNF